MTAPAREALPRRRLLALPLAGLTAAAAAAEPVPVRLGTLQFGTVQWLAEVIRRHRLDRSGGFTLQTTLLADTAAGRVAIMAGSADIVAADWPFVAVQRAAGTALCFAPFSNTLGGVMVRADAPIRTLADLAGHRLGVAGGPVDKSWLMVQAAGRAGTPATDLAAAARVVYGAPPLLSAKLQQGELDAVLTFWTFAARLQAHGFREAVTVGDCARRLGLPATLGLVGFVFHEDWARAHPAAISGYLRAAAEAQRLLATQAAEWQAIRPLMNADDDALFGELARRFVGGITATTAAAEQQTAEQVFDILLRTGGTRATGGISRLPEGIFWPLPTAAD